LENNYLLIIIIIEIIVDKNINSYALLATISTWPI